jgi:hypothetical protein
LSQNIAKKHEAETELRPEPPCYWLNRAGWPAAPQRTIIMTGVARSGTSFLSSVLLHLGLPMKRGESDQLSGHAEHVPLREALAAKDHPRLTSIVAEFDQRFDIWGWKAPGIRTDFETVVATVRNPCFVFVFKEPLSVAMRKVDRGREPEIDRLFRKTVKAYVELVDYAAASPHPCMLVSYDRATKRIDECIGALAAFAGIARYDPEAVRQAVSGDGDQYVRALARKKPCKGE